MLSFDKCITIYSILLHVANCANVADGDWLPEDDEDTRRVNDLLNGPCIYLVQIMLSNLPGNKKPMSAVTAISMTYLTPDRGDKAKRTGVVAMKIENQPNEDEKVEESFFTFTFDYLNLHGNNIADRDRLSLAQITAQNLSVFPSFEIARNSAKAFEEKCEVIQMKRKRSRVFNKRISQTKRLFTPEIVHHKTSSTTSVSEINSTQQEHQQQQQHDDTEEPTTISL